MSEVDITFHLVVIYLNMYWFHFVVFHFSFGTKLCFIIIIIILSLDCNYVQILLGSFRVGRHCPALILEKEIGWALLSFTSGEISHREFFQMWLKELIFPAAWTQSPTEEKQQCNG